METNLDILNIRASKSQDPGMKVRTFLVENGQHVTWLWYNTNYIHYTLYTAQY